MPIMTMQESGVSSNIHAQTLQLSYANAPSDTLMLLPSLYSESECPVHPRLLYFTEIAKRWRHLQLRESGHQEASSA